MDGEQQDRQPAVNGAGHNGDEANNGPPADAPPAPHTINVTFKHQNGQELTFKMKITTKMGKAMDAFSARMQREVKTMRFLLDGERINANHTLEDLDVDDDCQVEVFEEQIGGGA